MITVENREAVLAQGAISSLLSQKFTLEKLPDKLIYRLGKLNKKLVRIVEEFEESRALLVDKYGEAAEGEQGKRIPANRRKEFRKAFEGLLDETVEINEQPIPKELLDTVELTGIDWLNLSPIIDGFFEEE